MLETRWFEQLNIRREIQAEVDHASIEFGSRCNPYGVPRQNESKQMHNRGLNRVEYGQSKCIYIYIDKQIVLHKHEMYKICSSSTVQKWESLTVI